MKNNPFVSFLSHKIVDLTCCLHNVFRNMSIASHEGAMVNCSVSIELHWHVENRSTEKAEWDRAVNYKIKFLPLIRVTKVWTMSHYGIENFSFSIRCYTGICNMKKEANCNPPPESKCLRLGLTQYCTLSLLEGKDGDGHIRQMCRPG